MEPDIAESLGKCMLNSENGQTAVEMTGIAHPDAELFAAEHRLIELEATIKAIYQACREAGRPITVENEEELINDVFDADISKAADFINNTPAQTLAGAAVKMRLWTGRDEPLRQVTDLIERLLGKTEDGAKFLDAERDMHEAARSTEEAGDPRPFQDRFNDATFFIRDAEPQSLVSALVKLRYIVTSGCEDPDHRSCQQVIAFLQREVGMSDPLSEDAL